jgi:uncharacterized protein YciI
MTMIDGKMILRGTLKICCVSFWLLSISSGLMAQNPNPRLDPALATRLGADDYGMKMYVFAMLRTGENKTTDKAFIDSCFAGHMANIGRLSDEGLLVVAGPFGRNTDGLRGLFILNVSTVAEAEKLVRTDPAISSGLLKAELHPWYGSAALPEYLDAHDRIWRKEH